MQGARLCIIFGIRWLFNNERELLIDNVSVTADTNRILQIDAIQMINDEIVEMTTKKKK